MHRTSPGSAAGVPAGLDLGAHAPHVVPGFDAGLWRPPRADVRVALPWVGPQCPVDFSWRRVSRASDSQPQ